MQVWTNNAAIPAGYLPDGGLVVVRSHVMVLNATGSSRTTAFKLYIGSTPTVLSLTDNNAANATSPRANYIEYQITRNGTNIYVLAMNRINSAPGTASSTSPLSATTTSSADGPSYRIGVPNPDTTAIPLGWSMTMGVASTNYWATNVFVQLNPR